MAQKISYNLVDDIDGGKAVETVTFGIDDETFEIDLGKRNADQLRAVLSPYVAAGRRMVKTVNTKARGRSRLVVQRRVDVAADPRAVRAWARANRISVPERGRIPGAIIDRYRAAGH
jgi:nucleoid-associated protein Lsr2